MVLLQHYECCLVNIGLVGRVAFVEVGEKSLEDETWSNDMHGDERYELINTAREMIRIHGYIASAHAGMRSVKALAVGDLAKFHFWKRVSESIQELQRGSNDPKPS